MRKIVLYGVIVFQVLLIVSLVRGLQLSRKSSSRIESMQQTISKLEEERKALKTQEQEVSSPEYLERVAREELHLSKPGETVVIIPDSVVVQTEVDSENEGAVQETTIWKRWIAILSGKI
jgi:cell division protein FtsL